ncbi:MAG: hypothetical protein ACXAAM_02680 [Candidatus Heimdallarchaeaceae archaeon]|jgi:hypothetical protein
MTKTKNFKAQKVKEIGIKKKLEREIEEILGKQITVKDDSKNGSYKTKRNSVFRKDEGN